jgi:predicted NUDIX family NTP pyrophosphohydrolase
LANLSAGILLFRKRPSGLQVLLVHPGGPFWKKKDLGAWSIPKGEYTEPEDPLAAAKREFAEETGIKLDGDFLLLGAFKQPSGKMITAWALEGDCSVADIRSNTFTLEWPPKSGRQQEFPEIDRAEWFDLAEAHKRILKGQAAILDRLKSQLGKS